MNHQVLTEISSNICFIDAPACVLSTVISRGANKGVCVGNCIFFSEFYVCTPC